MCLASGLGFLGCPRNEGWGGPWSTSKAEQPLSHTFPGHGLDLSFAICLFLHPGGGGGWGTTGGVSLWCSYWLVMLVISLSP